MTPLIFFGSDRFSAITLAELIRLGSTPQLVVTDPPRPTGRKKELMPNEVEIIANNQKLKVLYYKSNIDKLISYIKQSKSIGLSASFPHLFPPDLIKAFPKNSQKNNLTHPSTMNHEDKNHLYNLHPSLLPQYRNVAPGPYAIAMGDSVTGITLQHIDEKIDHGSIVTQVSEPILPTDTTTSLLTRLFITGAKMFYQYLNGQNAPQPSTMNHDPTNQLVFTRKLKRESGYIEWDTLEKLIVNQPITKDETANPLINLRLTHHPERTVNILPDLIRALDTYERVWTTVPQAKLKRSGEKGELQLTLSLSPNREIMVLIPGKPKPIPYTDFAKYYL